MCKPLIESLCFSFMQGATGKEDNETNQKNKILFLNNLTENVHLHTPNALCKYLYMFALQDG